MRKIVKNLEPASLTTHRNTPHCDFDNYAYRTCCGRRYGGDGTIRSDEPQFDRQLNDVLNLNLAWIKNQRKAILDAVLQWWGKQRGSASRQHLDRQIQRRRSPPLAPYVQVAIWWLERKLARSA